ncbi:hypothetical protein OK074_5000 [Actinobacteria bacterium OK074]|nr:hypothetical protein OK074_5000 [Actinobacteria bacterium OK074]
MAVPHAPVLASGTVAMTDRHGLPRQNHATDSVTPKRRVSHDHFVAGEPVVVVRGSLDGELAADVATVVAPSWHVPTGEDGWRIRVQGGGERTFVTAHPRYLIHAGLPCPDCVAYFDALTRELLPQLPAHGSTEGDWYGLTATDQLIHATDGPGGSR